MQKSEELKAKYREVIRQLPPLSHSNFGTKYEPLVVTALNQTIGNHYLISDQHIGSTIPYFVSLPMQRDGIDIIMAQDKDITALDLSDTQSQTLYDDAINDYCQWRKQIDISTVKKALENQTKYLLVQNTIDVKTTLRNSNIYLELCQTPEGLEFGHFANGKFKINMANMQLWILKDRRGVVDVDMFQCLNMFELSTINNMKIKGLSRDHHCGLLMSPATYLNTASQFSQTHTLRYNITTDKQGKMTVHFQHPLSHDAIINIVEYPSKMYVTEDKNGDLKLVVIVGRV